MSCPFCHFLGFSCPSKTQGCWYNKNTPAPENCSEYSPRDLPGNPWPSPFDRAPEKECKTCGGDGIVDLSPEDFAKIKPYLDAGKHTYPSGEELQTMRPCPDCSLEKHSLADCINWNNNPRGDCGGRMMRRNGKILCETCFNR